MNSILASVFAASSLIVAGSSMAVEMPPLAKKCECTACHSIDKKIVGPSWMEVSNRYKGVTTFNFKGTDYPLEDGLVLKVSKGGVGNWSAMPMPPNFPGTSEAEARTLVRFVLSLAAK
jgi:cytochrome c551/c552